MSKNEEKKIKIGKTDFPSSKLLYATRGETINSSVTNLSYKNHMKRNQTMDYTIEISFCSISLTTMIFLLIILFSWVGRLSLFIFNLLQLHTRTLNVYSIIHHLIN